MDSATILKNVRDQAGLDDDMARQAVDATLRVLGQRITGDEARHLADQLPTELNGPLMEASAGSPEGERFGLEDFVSRVADHLGTESAQAERAASTVFHVLGRAVEPGEWGDVLAQLPTEMDALFAGDRPSDHNG